MGCSYSKKESMQYIKCAFLKNPPHRHLELTHQLVNASLCVGTKEVSRGREICTI